MHYIVESFCFLSLFWYTSACTPLYTLTCTLMQLLRINDPSILYQASLLRCLSTAVGLVHEPPIPNGVVNLWQHPISGAQCGAHGWWTDSNACRHNTQLLDDSASHPPLRRHQHHYQLAHIGQLVANARSHTKINFSPEKNCSKCMTFAVQLTGWHWAVCHTITHHRRAGGLCPVNSKGHCTCVAKIHSVPRGNEKTKRNPTARCEVPRSSLRWAGNLEREVTWELTQQDTDNCTVKIVIVPGALDIWGAMGTFNNCGNQSQCLDQVRSDESLYFSPWSPLQIWAGAHPPIFSSCYLKTTSLTFNIIISSISATQ